MFLCKTLSLFISNNSEVEVRKISSFYTGKRKFRREYTPGVMPRRTAMLQVRREMEQGEALRAREGRQSNSLLLAGEANDGFISLLPFL